MLFRAPTISLAVSLLGLLICQPLPAADQYRQAASESVKSYLAEHPRAAVTVGIIDAEGSHVFGFGQLNKDESKSQPNGKTIYQIGSITKVFTTTMLAEQVRLCHMKLDDPAQKYLPTDLVLPQEKDREITLEELATHHSGLPRLPQFLSLFIIGSGGAEDPYAALGWKQMAGLLPSVWLTSPIGSKYAYSNLGMGLLGQALVNATHSADYAELLTKRITQPLGMTDTGLVLSDRQTPRLAQGYNAVGKKSPVWHFGSLEGCGALYSTVDDLLVFAAANLGLKASNLMCAMELTHQVRPNRSWPYGQMGLGWHIQIDAKTKVHYVWHNGATYANTSMLFLVPSKKIGVVVLSNVGVSVDSIAVELVMKLLKEKQATPGE